MRTTMGLIRALKNDRTRRSAYVLVHEHSTRETNSGGYIVYSYLHNM